MRRLVVVCIGLLLSLAAAGAFSQKADPRFDAMANVPKLGDLRGKSCDVARAELREMRFALESCPPGRATGRYPANTINAQSLKPGTPASQLDGLRVTLEPGPESARTPTQPAPGRNQDRAAAAMAAAAALAAIIANAKAPVLPDLRGKTCEQARGELSRMHIELTECLPGDAGSRYPAGTISAQSQAPGTPASSVKGLRARFEPLLRPPPPQPVPVLPDVRGLSCDQASARLSTLRIVLSECLPGEARARYPAGTINAQSPAPGTPASRVDGLRVRFEPLPPPPPRLLPDLRGKTCDEAAAVLAPLELRIASCAVGAAVRGARTGRINEQQPNAGAALPLAGPIVLRVQPAPMVVVPALIGLGEAQASKALASRKLQARASGPAAAMGRRVLSQSPAAGTAVGPGSTVDIGLGLSVPRLIDLGCAAARERAAGYGHPQLECESRPATSPNETLGRVFEQTPPTAGAAIAEPATIHVALWVAQPVTVPDVRERALGEAISSVEAARLVAQPDRCEGECVVAQQSPAPGTVVDAGSAVKLDTREMVEVPDVVGQALVAAQSQLRQSRLRDAADANDHADDRIVQSQAPAANAHVAAESAVQLSTRRFASVPDLGGKTCDEARAAVAPDTFGLTCNDESSWRVTVFGTPHVAAQQPGARARAEVGVTIVAEARAPLPASAQWLGNVPLAAVASVVVAPFLGLGLWLAWPRPAPPTVATPAAPPAAPHVALPLGSPVVPPRAPSFEWRVAPDTAPAANLRWPSAPKAGAHGSRHAVPEMAWRVVADAGHVLLREIDVVSSGGDHVDR